MTPKEIKAALADENMQAVITKQVDAAVKSDRKRTLNVIKSLELPEDRNEKRMAKSIIASIIEGIKAD